jgi:hypothetical protein
MKNFNVEYKNLTKTTLAQECWYMFICKKNLPISERLSQEDCEFEASLGYIGGSCLKKQNNTKQYIKKTKKNPWAGM